MVKALAAFLAFSTFFSAAAQAAPRYASLAVVGGQGRDFHGIGFGDSQGGADSQAMERCSNARCSVVQRYVPGQCIHVALGTHQIWYNISLFGAREKSSILSACQRQDTACRILLSHCLPEQ